MFDVRWLLRSRTAARPSVDPVRPAGPGVLAMHGLPAHRGEEVTSAVMDRARSLIWGQSANRLQVQKALLVELLGGANPG